MSDTETTQDFEILPPRDGGPEAQEMRLRRSSDGAVFFAYRFEHPAVASTVVLYDRARDAVLLGRRERQPFAGSYCFPGGFLDVGEETVEQCAARELREETGVVIRAEDLQLVDVRSHPRRDPRDHVLDIGYYAEGDNLEARAADETDAIEWAPAGQIDDRPLAFDHDRLWQAVKERLINPGNGG
ncbi:MAG: NUDIX domain-containing protein [Candidatus Sumerlaeota bacterium]